MNTPTLAYINEDEIEALLAVRDAVKGFGPSFRVKRDELLVSLGGEDDALKQHLSYLVQHGLIGTNEESIPFKIKTRHKGIESERTLGRTPPFSTVYLTGTGIDFIRAMEAQPNVPKRLTVATAKAAANIVVAAGRIALTELAKATAGAYVHPPHG